jgi:hypothetical protein
VADPDAPDVAGPLVDFVLDLDPAVLLAELQLPVAAPAAGSCADDVAILRQDRHGRSADQQGSQDHHGHHRAESHRFPLLPWVPIGALEVNDAGGTMKEAESPGQGWDKTRTSAGSEDPGKGKGPDRKVPDEPTLRPVRDLGVSASVPCLLPAPGSLRSGQRQRTTVAWERSSRRGRSCHTFAGDLVPAGRLGPRPLASWP